MYILYMEKGSKKNNKNIVLHSLQKSRTTPYELSHVCLICIIIQILHRRR
jgi:hypothetical protein